MRISMCSYRIHLNQKNPERTKHVSPGRTRRARGIIQCDIIQCTAGQKPRYEPSMRCQGKAKGAKGISSAFLGDHRTDKNIRRIGGGSEKRHQKPQFSNQTCMGVWENSHGSRTLICGLQREGRHTVSPFKERHPK